MTKQWNDTFYELFMDATTRFHEGHKTWQTMFTEEELDFLSSIGYQPREMYDFIEDYVEEGNPSPSTALLVAAVRRDFFLTIQRGLKSESVPITVAELPTFGDELHGITYLPRIIKKAEGKLHGNLDPDIMYCCGGDRNFLAKHGNIHPADFLRIVWAARGDRQPIITAVRNAMKQQAQAEAEALPEI